MFLSHGVHCKDFQNVAFRQNPSLCSLKLVKNEPRTLLQIHIIRIAGGRAASSSVLMPRTLSFIPVVSGLQSEVKVKAQPSYYPTEETLRVHSWGLNNGWPRVSPRLSRGNRALSSGGVTMVVLPHRTVIPPSCPAWQTLNLSKVSLLVISLKGFPEVLRPNWDRALRSVEAKIHIFSLRLDHVNLSDRPLCITVFLKIGSV